MKTFALVASLPWIGQAFAQTQAATLNPWEMGKDVSFAGLVWFLVGYLLPKLMHLHREERAELVSTIETKAKSHREERDRLAERMLTESSHHRELLATIAEKHAQSAESGHTAARELGDEIRKLRQLREKETDKVSK